MKMKRKAEETNKKQGHMTAKNANCQQTRCKTTPKFYNMANNHINYSTKQAPEGQNDSEEEERSWNNDNKQP